MASLTGVKRDGWLSSSGFCATSISRRPCGPRVVRVLTRCWPGRSCAPGRPAWRAPSVWLGQLAFGGPHAEQRVAGGRLRFADVPQFVGGGVAFGAQAVAELVLAVEAVQFGEVELGVVVLDEGPTRRVRPASATSAVSSSWPGAGRRARRGNLRFPRCWRFSGGRSARRRPGRASAGSRAGPGHSAGRAFVAFGQGALGFVVYWRCRVRSVACARRRQR
jgi:hypothetical protein